MHQVSAWRRGARGARCWAGNSRDLPAVLKGDCASQGILQDGARRFIKGSAQGQAGQVAPITAAVCPDAALVPLQGSHQPGPLLRDAGCQEEEGLLHQEALAARLACEAL